jgi:hypothetical protein
MIDIGTAGAKSGLRSTFTVDPGFRGQLGGYNLKILGASRDTVYTLDEEFRLSGFNTSFRKTAQRLGGRLWLRGYGLGFPVLEGFSGFYAEHYGKVYGRCLAEGETHAAVYGFATPRVYLWYKESVKPLREGVGLIVNHRRLRSIKVSEAPSFDPNRHLSPDELVLQCCHCDRVRNYLEKELWEWVPDLPVEPTIQLSHGLCPHCLDTYYGDLLPSGQE